MQERYIKALIQKAQDVNDEHLSNEKLVRMIISKENDFVYDEKIEKILKTLIEIKNDSILSKG